MSSMFTIINVGSRGQTFLSISHTPSFIKSSVYCECYIIVSISVFINFIFIYFIASSVSSRDQLTSIEVSHGEAQKRY